MLLLDCSFTLHIFSYILIIAGCIVTSPIFWFRYLDLKSQTFNVIHPGIKGVSINKFFSVRCFGKWSEWKIVQKENKEVWQRHRNTSECKLTLDEANTECLVEQDFEDAVDVVDVNLLISKNYIIKLENQLSSRQNGFWIRCSNSTTTPGPPVPVPLTTVLPTTVTQANETDPPRTSPTTPVVTHTSTNGHITTTKKQNKTLKK